MARRKDETTIFRSGNSNAVRLPRGFASTGDRVRLRRLPGGRTLIEPVTPRRWPRGFLASFGRVTRDFEAPLRPVASRSSEKRAARLFDEE
jgi:virulence-associated protein VagC